MILYHFTARENLPSIAIDGLTTGEVPVTAWQYLNAVWLTNDGKPAGHGLSDARDFTPQERLIKGVRTGEIARFLNKRAIRMTVLIPKGDRNLALWPSWARKRLSADWYETLNRTGGHKASTWFLYWGVIPTSWIREVRDMISDCIIDEWAPLELASLRTNETP